MLLVSRDPQPWISKSQLQIFQNGQPPSTNVSHSSLHHPFPRSSRGLNASIGSSRIHVKQSQSPIVRAIIELLFLVLCYRERGGVRLFKSCVISGTAKAVLQDAHSPMEMTQRCSAAPLASPVRLNAEDLSPRRKEQAVQLLTGQASAKALGMGMGIGGLDGETLMGFELVYSFGRRQGLGVEQHSRGTQVWAFWIQRNTRDSSQAGRS